MAHRPVSPLFLQRKPQASQRAFAAYSKQCVVSWGDPDFGGDSRFLTGDARVLEISATAGDHKGGEWNYKEKQPGNIMIYGYSSDIRGDKYSAIYINI